jgi:nucleotide-binding universal stress UspA family protein
LAHILANAVKLGAIVETKPNVGSYLVLVDETPEAEVALRFAARMAARTGGGVEILAAIQPQEFVAWGAVQATIEAETRDHADEVVKRALDMLGEEGTVTPRITIRRGAPVALVQEMLAEANDIVALVLGAAASGNPGPLVSHFTGSDTGALPCPVIVVPGGLTREKLDALS